MKVSIRVLCMAAVALAIAFIATTMGASAQTFPQCTGSTLTIQNKSDHVIRICVKMVDCFAIEPHTEIQVHIDDDMEIPGVAGVANTTHEWEKNPAPPPTYWVPSLELDPTGNCFDVYFDDANCTITVIQAAGPPCVNQ